jgi:hypothetical protein
MPHVQQNHKREGRPEIRPPLFVIELFDLAGALRTSEEALLEAQKS